MPLWAREVFLRSELPAGPAGNSKLYFCTTLWTTFLVALLALGAQAQRQSTVVQLASNSSATVRYVPSPNDLIGAGASYWTYCVSSSAVSIKLVAEESPDGLSAHYTQISPVYSTPATQPNGNVCGLIQAGGLFGYPALNVLSLSGGTYSLWYSGTTQTVSTFPSAFNSTGATAPAQCDQANFLGLAPSQTNTQLIAAGSPGQSIYVCGGTFSLAAGTPTDGSVQLVYGTGSTCTGSTNLFLVKIEPNTPQVFPMNVSFKVPTGNTLCMLTQANGVTVYLSLAFATF